MIYEIKNLWFKYSNVWILEDLNFEIEKGKIFSIVGPNGGGKTTLLKLLLKLLTPSKGVIKYKGKNLSKLKIKEINIGYVPQMSAGYSIINQKMLLTAEDVIKLGLKRASSVKRVKEVMDLLKISNLKKKIFNTLSGGEKQKILIARALVNEPEVLIMDEPSTGIDAESETFLYDFLNNLKKEKGITIILVTHDLDIMPSISDTVGCLNKKIYIHKDVTEFLNCPIFEEELEKGLEILVHGKNIPHRLVAKH